MSTDQLESLCCSCVGMTTIKAIAGCTHYFIGCSRLKQSFRSSERTANSQLILNDIHFTGNATANG